MLPRMAVWLGFVLSVAAWVHPFGVARYGTQPFQIRSP
jgi:hypothetical protein